MKKIPSVRMPDPKAGVIRSEHPRAVGVNGLVEAENWILRDGSIQVRDGIVLLATPASTNGAVQVSTWDVWSGSIWSANLVLTFKPTQVFMDGTIGEEMINTSWMTKEFDWYWFNDVLHIYAPSDPDTLYTGTGVEYTDEGTSVIALASYDYQNEGSVIRDQVIAVLDDSVVCFDNTLETQTVADPTNIDWAGGPNKHRLGLGWRIWARTECR